MSSAPRQKSVASALQSLWAGAVIAGSCLGGELPLTESGITTVIAPACPPANFWSRLTRRVTPSSDLIGMPLHHRNFSADCYGENWRLKQFDPSTKWGQHRLRWHNHSLAMEEHWGWVFGKPPRGYIHDTSGHPMRSYFVPQPPDAGIAYVPGSDTLIPPRLVVEYPLYEYGQAHCPACEEEGWSDHQPSSKLVPVP